MTKKWIAINVMLLLFAGLLGWQLYVSVKRFNISNDPAQIQVVKKKAGPDGGLAPLQIPAKYSAPEYSIIPTHNLFSESRELESQSQPAAPPPPEPMRVRPVITSIIISGSSRVATITDPSNQVRSAAPGSGQQTIRPGDTFQGYVATDITEDGILFELGTNREFIPIHDPSKRPQPGGKTPILATRIVNFGAGTAAGGSPAVVAGAATPAARGIPNPAASTPARGGAVPIGGGQAPGRGVPQRQQETQVAAPVQGVVNPTWNQTVDPQGRIIINSPFGAFPVTTQPPQQVIKK